MRKRKQPDELADLVGGLVEKTKKKARAVAEDKAAELVNEIGQKGLTRLIRWGDKTFGGK